MNKQILFLCLLTIFTTMALSACKKSDSSIVRVTNKDQLIGSWKNLYNGGDDDGDGMWEAAEMKPVPGSEMITFNLVANGAGSVSFNFMGTPRMGTIDWQLMTGNEYIRIAIDVPGIVRDTMMYKFVSLSTNEFSVRDTVQPYTFDKFVKQ